ncbi:hypothetical protein ABH897_005598 [Paenibacillus sp. RC73]|uniref:hypothetical protein n=1 Tax=Paenibacillus sp. RC73 TaxID=3156250 RepID=UPI003834F9D7
MGELTGAVARAIPPPPDWDSVADKIGSATVRHLSNYVGSVPAAPSQQEIDQATSVVLPKPDISTPEADSLKPEVPDQFKQGKIIFDLGNTPAIETKDESKPFTFLDPIANIKSDPPGKPVFPGDPRNSSDGIKQPDKKDTGDPAPKPGKIVFEIPKPSAPAKPPTVEIPKPGGIVFELPKPKPTTGDIPIPREGGG